MRLLKKVGLGHDVFLSFLPLSHSYEHMAGMMFPISLGAQIYFAEGAETLAVNLTEARPTIMTAVPRLYEAFHQRILRAVARESGLRRKLFFKALALGRKRYDDHASLSLIERVEDAVLDPLVRDKLRARFGGRLKAMVSGGAPLNPEIGRFFLALGLAPAAGLRPDRGLAGDQRQPARPHPHRDGRAAGRGGRGPHGRRTARSWCAGRT